MFIRRGSAATSIAEKPHISFYHVRYTSHRLARSPELIGKTLRIYYSADDIRTLRAFLADGTELGELKAGGIWAATPHSLDMRQRIFRAKRLRQLRFGDPGDPVEAYLQFKRGKAKRSRQAASEIARIKETIDSTMRGRSSARCSLRRARAARSPGSPTPSNARTCCGGCSSGSRLAARKGHIVVLFCDEAQRLSQNFYEWLRDVHDQLAYHGIRLITFLIGQPQLLGQKAKFQMKGDEQIVARFMIEQLQFHGIRNAAEAATCLAGYDKTRYPEGSGPGFTGFFLPKGFGAGLRLEQSGADLWNAFVRAHAQAQLAGAPEIQMDYFTRAIESLLAQGLSFDDQALKLDESYWARAVEESGYVSAQRSVVPPTD